MSVYDDLGVKKYLNAHDTCTAYGGSRMEESVLDAMANAARHFVDMDELQDVLGKEIAKYTHNEGAYITSGASAGLLLATVALIAGDDCEAFRGLPDSAASCKKNEIISMRCQHNPFLHAVTAAGAKLTEVGDARGVTEQALAESITERTAGIFYFAAGNLAEQALPLETLLRVGKASGVPVVVDAAAQLPPVTNLWHYTREGASMAVFSGGKTLRGPQCSGLVLGSAEMISRCKKYGSPVHGICRSSKVGKEEMVGLYVAVRNYLALDFAAQRQELRARCEQIAREMEKGGVCQATIVEKGPAGQEITLVYGHISSSFSAQQLQNEMRAEGVFIGVKGDSFFINPYSLHPQEVEQVIRTLQHCLRRLHVKSKE